MFCNIEYFYILNIDYFLIDLFNLCIRLLKYCIIFYILFLYKYKNIEDKYISNKIFSINITFWWEIWSFYNYNKELENYKNSPWSMYKIYRYSIWNNWHILEERICLFLIILYI